MISDIENGIILRVKCCLGSGYLALFFNSIIGPAPRGCKYSAKDLGQFCGTFQLGLNLVASR